MQEWVYAQAGFHLAREAAASRTQQPWLLHTAMLRGCPIKSSAGRGNSALGASACPDAARRRTRGGGRANSSFHLVVLDCGCHRGCHPSCSTPRSYNKSTFASCELGDVNLSLSGGGEPSPRVSPAGAYRGLSHAEVRWEAAKSPRRAGAGTSADPTGCACEPNGKSPPASGTRCSKCAL